MSVKGKRIKKIQDEPTLLGNIENIIKNAELQGFIVNYKVDIEKIAQSNNIHIVKENLPESLSGYLRNEGNVWIIGVNKNHHHKRQRFTIAHEFAHYCLHKKENEYFEDTTFFRSENDTPIEYKANEFAAELLMPEVLFRKAIKSGIKKTVELAELFMVSLQAIQLRGKQLGYSIKSNE